MCAMWRMGKIVCALGLLAGLAAPAWAQQNERDTRGELLYATHCKACHTSEIHWREKRLATGWNSLRAQVRRWQANAALGWSNDDIAAVTRYLNDTFYHFPEPGRKISKR